MLGPEYTIREPDERDAFGQYSILPGHTHIYPFRIPMLGGLKVTAAHILPNSQDFSIVMWISSKPLDGLELDFGFGHLKPGRRPFVIDIHDELLKVDDNDDRHFLNSSPTHYLNVKNLQNRQNAYELIFEPFTVQP